MVAGPGYWAEAGPARRGDVTIKRKLIEVALPLEAINRESAREKSIRHGHPSTLHLWWARRPLAACRAVLFSQLVDDPSAHPDKFPTEEAQAAERQRLFDLVERLVVWENINDEALLKEAHGEILKSTGGHPPAILDPFAGGGSIPLEAQRLGLEAHASDLNPVAVLINKALVEIPPKFAEQTPVFPGAVESRLTWPKALGLAEDVRRYGQWMRDEAERRIGDLYPQTKLGDGTEACVLAWIWARTVTCPNPACGIEMPLVNSWWLCKKKGKEAYIVPSVTINADGKSSVQFAIGHDPRSAPTKEDDGTVSRTGARCVACGTAAPLTYVRSEGRAGRVGDALMAVVAEGVRRRHYIAPSALHVEAAHVTSPADVPEAVLPKAALGFRVQAYGMTRYSSLFSPRQLVALNTFCDLVGEARDRAYADALSAGLSATDTGLEAGGAGAAAYADAIAVYLGLLVGRVANRLSKLTFWHTGKETVEQVFARQALSMIWVSAEANPFSDSSGNAGAQLEYLCRVVESLPAKPVASVEQANARTRSYDSVLVATDPPYYDNVPYADLSDFFYGWLRRSLLPIMPSLMATIQTPKDDELIAEPNRHGGRQAASQFFEVGFKEVFTQIRREAPDDLPITVFYAFKQSEDEAEGLARTGWQTLLEGMLKSGWEVTATWPMRTELAGGLRERGRNALASSIVLALRPRSETAETISRRGFVQVLKLELPRALRELQQGSIAPVDLAQAAIGPGMSVFSRYSRVLEADGSEMTVRTALAIINQALDEVLAEQEGDFDAETRFAVKWFSQFGWNEAPSGEADVLTRAVNTSVAALERGGIFRAAAGKARLLEPSAMSQGWNPAEDKDMSVWEVAVRLGHSLIGEGLEQTARLMGESATRVDLNAVKELAYLMYSVCERKGWAEPAMLFNALGTSWSDVSGAARVAVPAVASQGALDFSDDGE